MEQRQHKKQIIMAGRFQNSSHFFLKDQIGTEIVRVLNSRQLYGIRLFGVPLAYIDILVVINTYIMAVHQYTIYGLFVLKHELQLPVSVFGFGTTRI